MLRLVGRCHDRRVAIRRLLGGQGVRWVVAGLLRRWRRVEVHFLLPVQLLGCQAEPLQAAVGQILLPLYRALLLALSYRQLAFQLPLLRRYVRSVLEPLVRWFRLLLASAARPGPISSPIPQTLFCTAHYMLFVYRGVRRLPTPGWAAIVGPLDALCQRPKGGRRTTIM